MYTIVSFLKCAEITLGTQTHSLRWFFYRQVTRFFMLFLSGRLKTTIGNNRQSHFHLKMSGFIFPT